ncbi:hypothetical protein FSP39_010076 [Pinctada imbricata]|uniref:HIT-type domain-containing protein n=1 Tax=Pinctada imbricata TaxID=66713 RepID=A0AA88XF10_PINIB|nr:hypothetical protein FSP39_010076 [Pinctada imbricata]
MRRSNIPRVRYLNNHSGICISVPQGIQFPFHPEKAGPIKPVQRCGMEGCKQPKKYSCSKTGVPLCSLECYKRNLTLRQPTKTASVT